MLEYEETNEEHSKPAIILEVAEPADDMEKNWKVTIITANHVSYTCSLLLLLELFDFQLSSLLHGVLSLYLI